MTDASATPAETPDAATEQAETDFNALDDADKTEFETDEGLANVPGEADAANPNPVPPDQPAAPTPVPTGGIDDADTSNVTPANVQQAADLRASAEDINAVADQLDPPTAPTADTSPSDTTPPAATSAPPSDSAPADATSTPPADPATPDTPASTADPTSDPASS